MTIDVKSPWYPYQKSQESFYTLAGSVDLPRKICDYLIDAPKGDYTPIDDNTYPRVRLWKYLYYDGERPLDNPLPTIAEKMSVVFNPKFYETPPTEKGFRLIPQIFVKEAQTKAQTRVMCYMGRTMPSNDDLSVSLAVTFSIWTNYTYELNTKTDEYSRSFAIEQALIEALHGVNMDGVGTFYFSRFKHPDCGSRVIFDGDTNVGRELTIALDLATEVPKGAGIVENMPFLDAEKKIRLGGI